MQLTKTGPLYSASDLISYTACLHLVGLEHAVAEGRLDPPDGRDPSADLAAARGMDHERATLELLRREGKSICTIPTEGVSMETKIAATLAALHDGADVIYQAAFLAPPWRGYADFLLKVDRPSALGPWSYEVADTKLARGVKPYFVLQLCVYSDLLAAIQQVEPRHIRVVLGTRERVTLATADFMAYFRRVRQRFLDHMAAGDAPTYPEPTGHCEICRWAEPCQLRREADDHLSLVANMRSDQAARLRVAGLPTVEALARARSDQRPAGMSVTSFDTLRQQAQLQARHRRTGQHEAVRLPYLAGRGLALLPEPSPGDIFFDMEGDPYQEGGLEYLFGYVYLDDAGEPQFEGLWGHDRVGEKKAFEQFMDVVTERRRRFPDMHVYHYAAYEENALKRLASLHGTREEAVDDLLRGQVLVDLYRVVRQSLRISQPSYLIKKLETFYMEAREADVKNAGASIVAYEQWIETQDPAILADIGRYNEEDCRSTLLLRNWLLGQRAALEAEIGEKIPWAERPDDENAADRQAIVAEQDALKEHLCDGLPEDAAGDDASQAARRLMADLLDYHRREAKPDWWAFFERCSYDADEWIEDADCLGGLVPSGDPPRPDKRSQIWTLRFPPQEYKLRPGDEVYDPATGGAGGSIVRLDGEQGILELRRGPKLAGMPLPVALIPGQPLETRAQRAALRRLAEAVADGSDSYRALHDGLALALPRLAGRLEGALLQDGTIELAEAQDVCRALDRSTLVIQGPPGSGKTYTGARLIVDLLERGKRIGVAALSHKAIHNLLAEVESVLLASPSARPFNGLKKCSADNPETEFPSRTGFIGNSSDAEAFADQQLALIAGTSWLFSRTELDGTLDYLFIDEAGQISLADALAMGTSATNLVLLGDPQQLPQVAKGVHPGRSGVSVLEHLLDGRATVPPDRGLFLDRTHRLHPDICAFVSEISYDGRLRSAPGCQRQRVDSAGLVGAGLRFIPVEHEGNSQASVEEAERIGDEITSLTRGTWTDRTGEVRPLRHEDILVVAPFNLQVHTLRDVLPAGVRVGTVDKFQGQEAPVVFFSMSTSSGAEIPRNLEFLFSRNRINVAISRAKCLAVVVASPDLLDIDCRTIEQMGLLNAMCRLVELASPAASQAVVRVQ